MATFSDMITTIDQLREHVPMSREAAIRKQIARLDEHCRAFIARDRQCEVDRPGLGG